MTKTQRYTMRYSPKPMREYGQSTAMLDTVERWNLAYLSHPFEQQRFHKDPHFAVHVRRTAQTRLDGGGLDLAGMCPPEMLVESFFRLPAPRAVQRLLTLQTSEPLPMFKAYGSKWVETMQGRAKQCWYDEHGMEPEPVDLQNDTGILDQLLKRAGRA